MRKSMESKLRSCERARFNAFKWYWQPISSPAEQQAARYWNLGSTKYQHDTCK
ncbi:hypothetical Protein YC6258_05366 [Gynuella sunshinyii YC6258]|uniref:Uncharacterized protein n=1 Tax=Gynuella sunshinyii YC6258 TaxID=1445510 RepID=A0A0C5VT83_9GAMM|nr:hypothetical Protein YC6258_05366 [Gynuella sunshinyii YC6258]